MKIDWKKDCMDTMWAMFWLQQGSGRDTTDHDRESIRENIARLIRMATQKNAGQRGSKDTVDWNSLEHTMMAIVCAATSLALHGEFGSMPETIEEA